MAALPVLVAGAGPVGTASALLLARFGVPSLVLEAKPGRDAAGSRAICMQRDVLDILDRIGCAEAMVAEGVTWNISRTYYRDHELLTTTFPDPGQSALPPWINISQSSSERHLFGAVARQPLVEVRFGHRVTAVVQDGSGVAVQVEGPRRTQTIRGSHLVAADGAASSVRRLLGIDFPGRSFPDQFLITDIRCDLAFAGERRFFFDPVWNPGRQVLLHPQPGGLWRIDWQVGAGYDLEADRRDGGVDARIRAIVGERPYEIDWISAYRFHERVAATLRTGRVLFAGDAGHLFAPFGARGLNSGIQDAENLAWKIAFARQGWVRDTAAEVLLESYALERRAAALENLRVTSATMEFLCPQTEKQWAWRRATLERAVSDEGSRRRIDSGRLAEPFWYTDSPITTASPAQSPAAGAPPPPAPGVLCPDAPCADPDGAGTTRLRRLLGRGFVILVRGPADTDAVARACRDCTDAPVRVHALATIDMEGVLGRVLRSRPGTAYVIRPDGHIAAVVEGDLPTGIGAALHRALGGGAGGA